MMDRSIESQQLRASLAEVADERDRLANIFDILYEGIVVTDADQIIRRFNRGASDIFGYSAEEIIGRPLDTLLPAAMVGHHRTLVRAFGDAPEISRHMGLRTSVEGQRKDGSIFPAEVSIAKSREGDGWAFSAVVRDVTDARRLEAQLVQAQKLEALGTLAAGIAHDLNNSLVPIVSYAELLAEVFPAKSPDRDIAMKIVDAAEHARDLVRRIVEFSRDDTRGTIPVDPALVMRRTGKILRDSLPSHIRFTFEIGADLPVIRANPTELSQALVNIVTNAAQAIGDNRGAISVYLDMADVNAAEAERWVNVRPGRYLRLAVTDDGPGMEEDVQQRIFEPFFTTKPPGQGSGLGLSVVHGIFRNLKGFIEVETAPGSGTVFRCHIPCDPEGPKRLKS